MTTGLIKSGLTRSNRLYGNSIGPPKAVKGTGVIRSQASWKGRSTNKSLSRNGGTPIDTCFIHMYSVVAPALAGYQQCLRYAA